MTMAGVAAPVHENVVAESGEGGMVAAASGT